MSTGFTNEQNRALALPLAPTDVRQVDGNSYVPGWRVIDKLNAIFGPDGWMSETREHGQLALFQEERQRRDKSTYTLHKAVFFARVRLTVHGQQRDVVHEGTGTATGSGSDPARAIETALMSAETIATKRAARQLGHTMGLALYDEDQRHVGVRNGIDLNAIAQEVRDAFERATNATEMAEALRANRDRLELLPDDATKQGLRQLAARKQKELAEVRKAGKSRADQLAATANDHADEGSSNGRAA